MKKDMIPIEELLLEDSQKREALAPHYFYEAKLPSIQMAQEIGLSDYMIEKALGITIKPEHRKTLSSQ